MTVINIKTVHISENVKNKMYIYMSDLKVEIELSINDSAKNPQIFQFSF